MVLIAIWPVQKSQNAVHLTGHKDSGTKQILREKWPPAGTGFEGSKFRDFSVPPGHMACMYSLRLLMRIKLKTQLRYNRGTNSFSRQCLSGNWDVNIIEHSANHSLFSTTPVRIKAKHPPCWPLNPKTSLNPDHEVLKAKPLVFFPVSPQRWSRSHLLFVFI